MNGIQGLTQAEIVIIGGGIIGCSIAYHLTRMGKTDVLLLEKSGLTHGATWHAAGLVGQLRASRNLTRMLQRSVALYDTLEAETGQATDWKRVGSLRVASSPGRQRMRAGSSTTMLRPSRITTGRSAARSQSAAVSTAAGSGWSGVGGAGRTAVAAAGSAGPSWMSTSRQT